MNLFDELSATNEKLEAKIEALRRENRGLLAELRDERNEHLNTKNLLEHMKDQHVKQLKNLGQDSVKKVCHFCGSTQR